MKVLIVILLAACVAAEQKQEAESSMALGSPPPDYHAPAATSYVHVQRHYKREASPEPEPEAYYVRPAYGAVSHNGGLGWSSLGYRRRPANTGNGVYGRSRNATLVGQP